LFENTFRLSLQLIDGDLGYYEYEAAFLRTLTNCVPSFFLEIYEHFHRSMTELCVPLVAPAPDYLCWWCGGTCAVCRVISRNLKMKGGIDKCLGGCKRTRSANLH